MTIRIVIGIVKMMMMMMIIIITTRMMTDSKINNDRKDKRTPVSIE